MSRELSPARFDPCPRCGAEGASVRYAYDEARIVRCPRCTLLYLDPQPSSEELGAVYGDSYFTNEAFPEGTHETLFGYSDYVAERGNKQPQYARIGAEALELLPPLKQAPRLLEVGCGFGYFLDEAFELGFEVRGIEFNVHAVERLRRKYAFPIQAGALEELALEPGSIDVAAMFDVIEHLRDPFASLDKLFSAVAPGGLLVVTTMDSESLVSRLVGKRLEDFRRTREHLFFFSRATLADILDEHGFDPLVIRSVGHTFELGHLLRRLALYNRPVFGSLGRLASRLGLSSLQIPVNPRTKMIAIARRRARPGRLSVSRGAQDPALAAVPELDRTLIEELAHLDRHALGHYRWVFDLIEPHLGRSVLEVGSGIGVISKHLLGRCDTLVLSDYREIYLEKLRERFGDLPHLRYARLDLNERPYPSGGVELDTVVCLNVLEHIEDDAGALAGLAELLPRGGRLILQVPNHPWLFGSLDESYGHYRRYSPRSLRQRLAQAGFRTRWLRRFNPYSMPWWLVAGKLLKRRQIDRTSLRSYQAAVPFLRRLDVLSRVTGISLLVCAERE